MMPPKAGTESSVCVNVPVTAPVVRLIVIVKVPDNDLTFTITINRTTGAVTGTFTHTDDSVPAFGGIIYQKGPNAGGYGYFMTKQPVPIDYTGESGAVT